MSETRKWLLWLIAAALVLQVALAGWGDLYNETDGQYAGAARVMAEGGSWLIPENNGVPRLVKPPLQVWLMAGSMKVLGVNEFAARLPNALAVTGWVIVTFLFAARLGGPQMGFVAGVVLLTSLGTATLGRIVQPEPLFSLFLATAFYCFLRWSEAQRFLWSTGFWLAVALSCFVKGWHGLVFAALIVTGAAVYDRRFLKSGGQRLSLQFLGIGLLLIAAINLPWLIYIEAKFPGFLRHFFIDESLGHAVGSTAVATGYENVPRWQFFLLHLAWWFPWSLLVLPAAIGWLRDRTNWQRPDLGWSLVAAWAGVTFAVLMVAGQRQDYYGMMMWPTFAIASAWLLTREDNRLGYRFLPVIFLVGMLAGAVARSGLFAANKSSSEMATAWSTLGGFDAATWSKLGLGMAIICAGGFILTRAAARSRRNGFGLVSAAAALCSLGAIAGVSGVAPYFSQAEIARRLLEKMPEAVVYWDGSIDKGSALLFYWPRPILLIDQDPAQDFAVRKFGIGKERFRSMLEVQRDFLAGRPGVVVAEIRRLDEWKKRLPGGVEISVGQGFGAVGNPKP